MANRFPNPNIQFADATGTPYAGGTLGFFASGTSTPLTTYSDALLTSPNTNPVVLDSAGRAGAVFLQNMAYKAVLKDVLGNTIWTMDPVDTSDFSAVAQFQVNAGNPNGTVAGTAGSGSIPSSVIWDASNNILYVCTTSGTASTAVWTAVNAAAATGIVPSPQGYLTLTSSTPIITGDVVGATAVFYTPYVGNTVPIYNGSSFLPTTFAELTLSLVSNHAADSIYDIFVFNNAGAVTLVTGPAWSTQTPGSSARGTGAGTTQLQRISGLLVNAVSLTGRNGSTTYAIGANLATYLGSLYIDHTAGQVTCHRTYGQNRKFGVWNPHNRAAIILKAGESTASWGYTAGTIRASNNVPSSYSATVANVGSGTTCNGMTVLIGLAEEELDINFTQKSAPTAGTTGLGTTSSTSNGIGVNSITASSGTVGFVGVVNQSGASTNTATSNSTATYKLPPALGLQQIFGVEVSVVGGTGLAATYYGTEANYDLSCSYRG